MARCDDHPTHALNTASDMTRGYIKARKVGKRVAPLDRGDTAYILRRSATAAKGSEDGDRARLSAE